MLDAIYAAYGVSWDVLPGADSGARNLAQEAIFLSRLVVALLPAQPEARGLLALLLYCEARRTARRDASGGYVPLKRQNPALWSRELIIEAEQQLSTAASYAQFGRYQCEAAIQSVHVQSPVTGRVNHAALATLYQLLASHSPSIGVLVAQAGAMLEAGNATEALRLLQRLAEADVCGYQPYWVTLAHVQASLGASAAMRQAQQRAMGLTQDPAVRAFLAQALPTA